MSKILRILLPIIILGLIYWLYYVLSEPVRKAKALGEKDAVVKERMEAIGRLQMAYRSQYGSFAQRWDSLLDFGRYGRLPVVNARQAGDTTLYTAADTTWVGVRDSLFQNNYPLDSLPFVPYGNGQRFVMETGTVTQGSKNIPVLQITDTRVIKGREHEPLVWGSLTEVRYSGNWK